MRSLLKLHLLVWIFALVNRGVNSPVSEVRVSAPRLISCYPDYNPDRVQLASPDCIDALRKFEYKNPRQSYSLTNDPAEAVTYTRERKLLVPYLESYDGCSILITQLLPSDASPDLMPSLEDQQTRLDVSALRREISRIINDCVTGKIGRRNGGWVQLYQPRVHIVVLHRLLPAESQDR